MIRLVLAWIAIAAAIDAGGAAEVAYYQVPRGSGPHDVAPAADGTVWYTGQRKGVLGRLDPKAATSVEVALGPNAMPHGVVVGPDGAAWVTEGGQNAIARVDAQTHAVKLFPLPSETPCESITW